MIIEVDSSQMMLRNECALLGGVVGGIRLVRLYMNGILAFR